jgi:hypothetical protein
MIKQFSVSAKTSSNDEYDIHDVFNQQNDSDCHSNGQDDESVGEDNENNINDIDHTLFF